MRKLHLGTHWLKQESDLLQVLAGICVAMWLPLAAITLKRAISGKMFFAPCLGTDLFLRRVAAHEERQESRSEA